MGTKYGLFLSEKVYNISAWKDCQVSQICEVVIRWDMTMVWAPKMHTEFWLRNLSANGHLGDLEGNRNIIKIKKYVSEDKR